MNRLLAALWLLACGCSYTASKLEPGDGVPGGEPSTSAGDQTSVGDGQPTDAPAWDGGGDTWDGGGDTWLGDPGGDDRPGDPWVGDDNWGDPRDGGDPWGGDGYAAGDSWDGGDPWGGDGDALGDPGDPLLTGDVNVTCQTFAPCTDVTTGISAGHAAVPAANDMAPLCSGVVLLANSTNDSLSAFSITNGSEVASYSLSGTPVDVEVDHEYNFAFATLEGENGLAKVDLIASNVATITLADIGHDIAIGNAGMVFVSIESTVLYDVAIVNGCVGTVTTAKPGNVRQLLAYDRPDRQLLSGSLGLSPATLTRHLVDEAGLAIVFDDSTTGVGSNGRDVVVSPDGDHLVYPCASGNGAGYTIWDMVTDDFSLRGELDTGSFPTAAAFSPDGTLVAASNGTSVTVFDVASHSVRSIPPFDATGCGSHNIARVAFSPGGAILYAMVDCGGAGYRLYWWTSF